DLLRTVPTPTLTTIPATGRGTVTNFSQALVDRNPYTCAEDLRSVNMTFAVPTHLTVLRLQGARLAYIGRKPGAIITASNDNFKTSVCSDGSRVFEVDTLNAEDSTVDVYCNTLVPATHFRITIRDFRRVCTVYASDACTLSYSRLPCPDDYCKRCFNEMCDMATGQCKIGCLGYSNFPYCDKACLKGYFGLNCLFKCSSCFNGNCDPSSGLCLKGCDGFSDPPMCTIPCEKSHGFNCSCSQTCQKCRKASRLCEMCLPDHRLNISDPSTCIPIPKIQRGFLSSTLLPNGSPIALKFRSVYNNKPAEGLQNYYGCAIEVFHSEYCMLRIHSVPIKLFWTLLSLQV
ncbi:hypothetical protein BgiBS90_026046, partial [Biomphalaria glabrata]